MEATTLSTKVMLEHKKGTPLRFPIGTRVEVREQPESYTGRYLGMYSIGTCEGGKQWLPALVHSHEFRQDDWCPGFVCAYSVLVDGDVTPDGMQIASPVREDDDRCIRLLLESGSAVTIGELKNRADLNGQNATIIEYKSSMGRFAVKLTIGGETVAVKRENLVHDMENTIVNWNGVPQKKLNPSMYYGIDPNRLR